MASGPAPSSRKTREASRDISRYHFAFTKLQAGLLAAGLVVLMGLFFSLGFVVADRDAARRVRLAGAGGKAPPSGAARPNPARKAVVRLGRPPGRTPPAGEKEPPATIEPEFYQVLVRERPAKKKAIAPLRLSGTQNPGPASPKRGEGALSLPSPPPRARAEKPRPAPPVGKRAAAVSPAAPAGRAYVIQVLSARAYAKAEQLRRALRSKGVYAYIERADLGERGVWHRVRIGRFPDRASARRALAEMRARQGLRGGTVVIR